MFRGVFFHISIFFIVMSMRRRLFSITYFWVKFWEVSTGLVSWVGLVVSAGEKTAKLHYSFCLYLVWTSHILPPMFSLFFVSVCVSALQKETKKTYIYITIIYSNIHIHIYIYIYIYNIYILDMYKLYYNYVN